MSFITRLSLFALMTISSSALHAITWTDCHADYFSMRLQCAQITVPKDHRSPDDGSIQVHVIKVPAAKSNVHADPLVFLAGGPGQAASDTVAIVASSLATVQATRDLYFIDQRGTGKTDPLQCPEPNLDPLTIPSTLETVRQEVSACLAQIQTQLGHYSTRQFVADIDAIFETLGIAQINLYGGSYGTRVAQLYMRHYPNRLRSVVLDAVVPMDLAIGNFSATFSEAWLDVVSQCEQHAPCAEAFPDLPGDLRAARANAAEFSGTTVHPRTGAALQPAITEQALLGSISQLMYHPITRPSIPYLVHAAANGDMRPLLASMSQAQQSEINSALYFDILCNEDIDLFVADNSPNQFDDGLLHRFIPEVCTLWPRTNNAWLYDRNPIDSDIPTLLVSGAFDPVTPPAFADTVAQTLTNSLHVIAPNGAHTAVFHSCLNDTVAQFIDQASVENLTYSCLDKPSTLWFQTDANQFQ